MNFFISYAQNFEDVLLWRALKHVKNGFYIDVGANDPELHSVTKAFYDAGWHGINIEPLPALHRAFQQQRPRDINLAVAAGARNDTLTLYDVPAMNGWASLDAAVAAQHRADGHEVVEMAVPLRTLAEICQEHVRGDIHFLKIDVEGFEEEALRGMDFKRWRPWILAIEATLPNSRATNHAVWGPLVTGAGYRFAYFDGLNRYYVAEEQSGLLEVLSVQPNVFDEFISHHLDKAWRATERAEQASAAAHERGEQAERAREQAEQAAAALAGAIAQANEQARHAELARQQVEAEYRQLSTWARDIEQRLIATHRSTSWRVTRPLRFAGRMLRVLRGKSGQLSGPEEQIDAPFAVETAAHSDTPLPAAPASQAVQEAPALKPDADVSDLRPAVKKILNGLKRAAARPRTALAGNTRPRLAYVSPLPPAKSGVADYSAELVPELARFYDIDLVVDQPGVDQDGLLSRHSLRSLAWFEEHGEEYDRVLYHFGNSDLHRHMFALLARYPGTVVLHDFHLSGILDHLERSAYLPQAFLRALYESHGYTPLFELQKHGRSAVIWKYPANKSVIDRADGVIVHSQFSQTLAEQWYGANATAHWRTLPMLHSVPAGERKEMRDQARRRLALKDDDFVVCSFGMLGPIKCNDILLDAFLASPLAADPHCRLVFVGGNDGGSYGEELTRRIAHSPAAARIAITGFVDAQTYTDWLSAGDVMVQLRTQTRGETSRSVLDCLIHGVATVINEHGANTEFSDDIVLKLPDPFTWVELAEALSGLRRDPALRERLAQRAWTYTRSRHAPDQVGRLFQEAIEHFAEHGPQSTTRESLEKAPVNQELIELAKAIARTQVSVSSHQLLIDVSALVQTDLKTGIQRVVRSILLALIETPPTGYRIEPVYSAGGNQPYRYARRLTLGMLDADALLLEDELADLRQGDIFLGLDLFTSGTAQNRPQLEEMRSLGVAVYFVIYDLLPLLRPEKFPADAVQAFDDFVRTAAAVSNGLVCISRSVADELATWLAQHRPQRASALKLGYFHLGADIAASAPSNGLPPDAEAILASVGARPSFLMVGTIEPRKGHEQTLLAFELLWQSGIDVNLVIVGKRGWMVDALVERLEHHPERGARLHWLSGISDEMLLKLYEAAAALLAPSEGEGFGLPLIEAAQHHTPIVARDLPVFREVAGDYAYYFEGTNGDDLAGALKAWLALHRANLAPQSSSMSWLTWKESAEELWASIGDGRWYRELR